jgi:hypothetical protein
MAPHVLVASFSRSGTHLAIDLIRNNFADYRRPYISFLDLEEHRTLGKQIGLIRRLTQNPRVCKTHLTPGELCTRCEARYSVQRAIAGNCTPVYVVRDGRDVLVSQYCRATKEHGITSSFAAFLRSPIEIAGGRMSRAMAWGAHANAWLGGRDAAVHVVRFEDMIRRPVTVVDELERALGRPRRESFVDVRMSAHDHAPCVRFGNAMVEDGVVGRTAIFFRTGRIGDYREWFNPEDLAYFELENSPYKEMLRFLT